MSENCYLQRIKFAKTQQSLKTFGVKNWNNFPDSTKKRATPDANIKTLSKIFETTLSKFSELYVMVGKIGIESYYKCCIHFYIKHFAKFVIMQFIFSFFIVTYKSLFRTAIAFNQIYVV